jgi:hypothetical protein
MGYSPRGIGTKSGFAVKYVVCNGAFIKVGRLHAPGGIEARALISQSVFHIAKTLRPTQKVKR